MRIGRLLSIALGLVVSGCSLRGLDDLETLGEDERTRPTVEGALGVEGVAGDGVAPELDTTSPQGPPLPEAGASPTPTGGGDEPEEPPSVLDPSLPLNNPGPSCTLEPDPARCDAAQRALCAIKGASCDVVVDRLTCHERALCHWSAAADAAQCATVSRVGSWVSATKTVPGEYLGLELETRAGACIAELARLTCDPASREACTQIGASCDVVESLAGLGSNLCRWDGAASEALCARQLQGVWMPAQSRFALDHPGAVAPGADGACVTGQSGPALTTRIELCFEVESAFVANGGDFPAPDENEHARGIRFRVTDDLGIESLHDADPLTGCKTLELATFGAYKLRVLSKARFADGNEVVVMTDDVDSFTYGWTAASRLVPGLLPTSSARYTWPASPAGNSTAHVSTVMTALVRTFVSHSLTTGTTYRVYLGGGACTSPCVDVDRWGNRAVFLSGERTDKFVITSLVAELGSFFRIGGLVGGASGNVPDCELRDPAASSCADGASHTPGNAALPLGSEEHGNCAFAHGWAQYISASVWNRPDEADCHFGGLSSFNDCYEPGRASAFCYGAEPQTLDTGFERDWLGALWALERFDGCAIAFPVIVNIWESANPAAWTDADARTALLAAAPLHLDGSPLDCFNEALLTRISH